MDFLSLLIIFVSGFFIGRAYTYWTVYQALKDLAESEGLDLSEELEKFRQKHINKDEKITVIKIAKLQVESHGDMLYLFERDSDNFICQGKTIDELAKAAKEYKNILTASVIYDTKIFMFVNGTSKEFKE